MVCRDSNCARAVLLSNAAPSAHRPSPVANASSLKHAAAALAGRVGMASAFAHRASSARPSPSRTTGGDWRWALIAVAASSGVATVIVPTSSLLNVFVNEARTSSADEKTSPSTLAKYGGGALGASVALVVRRRCFEFIIDGS